MVEITFAKGVIVKEVHFQNGGKLIKLGIKVDDFIEFAKTNKNKSGYLNLDIKTSKEGKLYCSLDTYKKQD